VLTALHLETETVIKAHTKQNKDEHKTLRSQMADLSQQSGDQSDRALDAQAITKMAVDLSIDRNLAEHNKTREEMKRLREQAERQVEVLTEEIRQLKIELEANVKSIVASIGKASKKRGTEAQGCQQREVQFVGCKRSHIRKPKGKLLTKCESCDLIRC
jgi:hypothetical protein